MDLRIGDWILLNREEIEWEKNAQASLFIYYYLLLSIISNYLVVVEFWKAQIYR